MFGGSENKTNTFSLPGLNASYLTTYNLKAKIVCHDFRYLFILPFQFWLISSIVITYCIVYIMTLHTCDSYADLEI